MEYDNSLPTLLSQLLVAYTIELDNEFEHRMRGSDNPRFRVSLVMYANLLRLVPDTGTTARELEAAACIKKGMQHPSLPGMYRWGYVEVTHGRVSVGHKVPQSRINYNIIPTPAGLRAKRQWEPLFSEMDDRWRKRYGKGSIDALRSSLLAISKQIGIEMPQFMPVLGYEMRTWNFDSTLPRRDAPADDEALPLSALLSRVILAFTLEFEREFELSLAMCSDIIRVISAEGVRVRDLPLAGGVSKEAVAMAMTLLTNRRYVSVRPDPEEPRSKGVHLTDNGLSAQAACTAHLADTCLKFEQRFGRDNCAHLIEILDSMFNNREALTAGLQPYPEGWRAERPYSNQTKAVLADPRAALPRYPMVLHRGGWPDGS